MSELLEKITDAPNSAEKSVKGSNIHILGGAYKRDVNAVRESPALEIMNILRLKGAKVTYTALISQKLILRSSVSNQSLFQKSFYPRLIALSS